MSRNGGIRDGDPLRELPKQCVIKVGSLYYMAESRDYCWTGNLSLATKWPDRTAPDRIIAYWQKVHYKREVKDVVDWSAICGIVVLDVAEVIEVE